MTAIIERAGELLSRYDVLLVDVWGVMHDGVRAYAGAGDALFRFRAQGGTVVLVSNAPMPSRWVAGVLDEKGVRRDAWDGLLSSGDIALAHVAERGYRRVLHIGTERDLPLFETMPATRVDLDRAWMGRLDAEPGAVLDGAEAMVVTGLVDDRKETAETYRPLLELTLRRGLPLVCANPDLVVDVGGVILPCAGVLGELYEAMGGEVYWAGKPYPPAYVRAMRIVARLRGGPVAKPRVLAIGDALRTDIAGANAAGFDALFICQGIHRDEVLWAGQVHRDGLSRLLVGQDARPIAAMAGLAW